MSARANLEIQCLARLDELIASHEMILEYLMQEGLLTKEERKAIVATSDVAKALRNHLNALKGNKLQLLELEWILLPVERVKVTIVTDRNSREFSYNF